MSTLVASLACCTMFAEKRHGTACQPAVGNVSRAIDTIARAVAAP